MLFGMENHRFSQAVATYDRYSDVQQAAGISLIDQIQTSSPHTILDFGCGTGALTHRLAEAFPEAMVLGVDISPAMVAYAAAHHPHDRVQYITLDRWSLDSRWDVVFSNACLQWVLDDSESSWHLMDQLVAAAQQELVCSVLTCDTGQALQSVLEGLDWGVSIPAQHFLNRRLLSHRFLHYYQFDKVWGHQYLKRFDSVVSMLRHFKFSGTTVSHSHQFQWTRRHITQLKDVFYDIFGDVRYEYSFIMGSFSR